MTDPFIKRLGLEAELQVSDGQSVCTPVCMQRQTETILLHIIYSDSLYCVFQ